MLQTILIALVTVNIFTLHTQPAFTHFQNSYLHSQTNVTNNPPFDKQFDDIRNEVDQINAQAKNNTALNDFTSKITNIKTAGTELQTILNQFQLQIVNGVQTCPRVSTFNRTAIRQSIVKLESSERDSLNYVAGRTDCDFAKPGLNRISNSSASFVSFLNSTLDGKFCTSDKVSQEKPVGLVNINGNQFKTNLKAKNWYFGSTTASDYKIALFKQSIAYNLTDCPLEAPFLDKSKKCSNCVNGSVFNLGTQSCDSCGASLILNVEKGLCQSCLGDKKTIDGKLTCVPCAAGQFYNATSDKCELCGAKSYIDPITKACISMNCPSTTPRFNTTSLKCEPCGVSQQVDPNNITQCRKTNYIGLCNPAQPKYDVATKTCVACPNGTTYNQTTNDCLAPKASHFSTKMDQTHAADSAQPVTCQKGFVYIFKLKGCYPSNKTCGEHQFYNEKEGKCYMLSVNCKRDEKYNKKTHLCDKVNTTCETGFVFNYFSLTCKKVVQCKPDEQLNAQFHVCQKKKLVCQKGQVIDYKTKTCVTKHFITNPYQDKLSYVGDFKNYVKYYDTVKAADKLTTDCPQNTPFYRKSDSTCISCPSETPIFDLTNDKCFACNYNQYYSVYEHKCVDEKKKNTNTPSTVNRMNI